MKNKKELLEVLKKIHIENTKQRNKIVCALIGHSKICTACFGYRYCGRCSTQLGDSLGSIDSGVEEAVIIEHNCKACKENYKKCTWKDKIYVKNPFTKRS